MEWFGIFQEPDLNWLAVENLLSIYMAPKEECRKKETEDRSILKNRQADLSMNARYGMSTQKHKIQNTHSSWQKGISFIRKKNLKMHSTVGPREEVEQVWSPISSFPCCESQISRRQEKLHEHAAYFIDLASCVCFAPKVHRYVALSPLLPSC